MEKLESLVIVSACLLVVTGCERAPTSEPPSSPVESTLPNSFPAPAGEPASTSRMDIPPAGPSSPRREFDYATQIGLVVVKSEKSGCLAIHNPTLEPGVALTLVPDPESDAPTQVVAARVREKSPQACDDKLSVEVGSVTSVFYQVELAEGAAQVPSVVVAVLNPSRPIIVRGAQIDADLDGDDASESFRVCTSAEALHYSVWTGPPFEGRPRWHRYFYLGYDVEPSCTKRDYFGDDNR